jgi:hypothetical protein
VLEFGVGLTDLAKKVAASSDRGLRAHYDVGGFVAKIERYRPSWVALHGKEAAKEVSRALGHGGAVAFGKQKWTVAEAQVYVLPSASGSNRDRSRLEGKADRLEWFKAGSAFAPGSVVAAVTKCAAVTSTARRPDLGLGDSLVSARLRRVFNDQHRRLVCVVVSNCDHAERPASSQRNRVAGPPRRHGCLKGRRVSRRPILLLEPESEGSQSGLPSVCRLGPNGEALSYRVIKGRGEPNAVDRLLADVGRRYSSTGSTVQIAWKQHHASGARNPLFASF